MKINQRFLTKSLMVLPLFMNLKMMAQTTVQGEYYFRRQEMVAGFNFSADGKFQFFYSYGAVDRSATGSFLVEGNTLKLKSDKEAGKDFTILQQSKEGNGYTVHFKAPSPYLLKNIACLFFVDGKQQVAWSDDSGRVQIEVAHCDSIFARHLLYPDIVTLIKDQQNTNNHFTLSLNPSLEQVSFKGIDFKIENDHQISCLTNYFMEMENIAFLKQ
jgi:hypothetical protein